MESRFRNLAIVAAALIATPLFATPTGTLSITNVSTGGVTVSATTIDWFPPVGGGFGDFATGNPTNINYSPTTSTTATLTAATNPFGEIKDILLGAGTIVNFIQFYTTATQTQPNPAGTGVLQQYPAFDLTGVAPGGSAQGALNDCAGVTTVGVSCSPLVNIGGTTFISPFVLTNRGAYTDVSLGVTLLAKDASGSREWLGGFTTQLTNQDGVRLTPDAVERIINGGGSVTNTYSGTFIASAVPEPATYAILGSGLMLLGLMRRRLRKQ